MESRFNNKVQFKKWLADGLVKMGWEQLYYSGGTFCIEKRAGGTRARIDFSVFDDVRFELRWNTFTLTWEYNINQLMAEPGNVAFMLEQMIYAMFRSFAGMVFNQLTHGDGKE